MRKLLGAAPMDPNVTRVAGIIPIRTARTLSISLEKRKAVKNRFDTNAYGCE